MDNQNQILKIEENIENKENKEKDSDTIFSNTIINSILSEKSSATVSNERSIKKLLKKIYDNENQLSYRENNELENSNYTQSPFIELNISKIEYSLSNTNSNKNHYKKFIKELKNSKKNKKIKKKIKIK